MTKHLLPKISRWATVALLITMGLLFLMAPANGDDQLLLQAEPVNFITLKENPLVDDDYVTLGDLFVLSGEEAAIRVIKAPKPGSRLAISSAALADFLRKKDIYWENANRVRQVVVTRTSVTIGEDEIKAALQERLIKDGYDQPMDLALYNRNLTVHLPIGTLKDLTIEDLVIDENAETFEATLLFPVSNGATTNKTISGAVIPVHLIPVLNRPVSRGETLSQDDFKIKRMATKRVGANVVTDLDAVAGMEAKRALRPGQPIRSTDLKAQTFVKKGALVTMTFASPGMQLSTVGKALESGGQGDIINIVNPKSKQTIMARVIAPNRVSVNLTGEIQMAAAQ